MNTAAFQIARIAAVIALVCIAAALATPKGRLPLALRGLAKMLGSCEAAGFRGSEVKQPRNSAIPQPSARKRGLAFILVLLAILLSLI